MISILTIEWRVDLLKEIVENRNEQLYVEDMNYHDVIDVLKYICV